jgi:hypothetical protein
MTSPARDGKPLTFFIYSVVSTYRSVKSVSHLAADGIVPLSFMQRGLNS